MLFKIVSALIWIAALLSGLAVVFVGASSESGRDGGRALAMMMLAPVFAGSLLLCFGLALWRGGLGWVTPDSSMLRGWLVLASVLAAAVIACFCAAVRLESAVQSPWALWPLRAWAHWVWPPVLVAGAALALWPGIRDGWPALAWQAPQGLVAALSMVACAGLLIELGQTMVGSQDQRVQEQIAFDQRRDEMIRDKVAKADPVADFVHLMSQTSRWEEPDIRAAALGKVLSHPDFSGAMSELLRSRLRDEAFTFLAYNDAPDPRALIPALREAFTAVPPNLQSRLVDASFLRADEYVHEVDRALAVADRFAPLGVDPMPMVRALKAALDAPRAYKIRLQASDRVEGWLARHGG